MYYFFTGVVNCIVNYYGFDQAVSAAAGNECGNQVKLVQSAFQRTIESSPVDGFQYALSLFNCESDMSVNDFYYMIADSWSMAIQYRLYYLSLSTNLYIFYDVLLLIFSAKSSLCSALSAVNASSTDDKIMRNFAAFSNQFWGDSFCSMGFCKLHMPQFTIRVFF